jgi:enoyl-CoA hydratase/carnithine racemase
MAHATTGAETAAVYVSRERDGVALVHLNRPPANSYNRAFLDDLNAAIDEVRWDDEIKGAVLVSDLAPRFFSAGADVVNFKNSTQQQRVMTVLHAHEILRKVENTPKVFVAAIHGHALGGGLEIALACDLRYGAETGYRLGTPEVTLGLLPGNGGTQRLPRLIGLGPALDLLLTGRQVEPAEAKAIGLLSGTFPNREEFDAHIERLAVGPPLAIANIKRAAYLGTQLTLDDGLALERDLIEQLFRSNDAREGLTAFTEKRTPAFTGA